MQKIDLLTVNPNFTLTNRHAKAPARYLAQTRPRPAKKL